jgi:hypothetical protein
MRLQKLLILGIIIVSLIPLYYTNRLLQNRIRPGASFFRLMFYMLLGFGLIFLYTFAIATLIFNLFPLAKR